ncbi:unnamed protein product [Oikopleura dioica]|uniref:CHCH domain-containing protein n=1 Tax=Oikopleura dioica TaxID=34765 RepID=E4X807_OIKDI|nr:unnamed protein product [Oikopleura dioica]
MANRPNNINVKHAYLLHKSSLSNPKIKKLEREAGKWMSQFKTESGKSGYVFNRPNTATRYGTSYTAKRPFARSNGLVEGSYAAEKSLPIGNPCDAELSNLMRCMRDNDYDNTPCLDVQKAYLTCCQTALSDYNSKKERFLSGERTDGLYSQKVINEMFEDVNQKLDMNQWRFICNSMSGFDARTRGRQPNNSPKEKLHWHVCEVPADLAFPHGPSIAGATKKDKL